jgi:hypothetical protein
VLPLRLSSSAGTVSDQSIPLTTPKNQKTNNVTVARGSSVLAKSVTPARIEANRADLIRLDAEDLATIQKYSDQLKAENKFQRFVFPPFGVNFGFPDKQ